MKTQLHHLSFAFFCSVATACDGQQADSPLAAIDRLKHALMNGDRQALMAVFDKLELDEKSDLTDTKRAMAGIEIAAVKTVGDFALALPKDETRYGALALVRRGDRWFISDSNALDALPPEQQNELMSWMRDQRKSHDSSSPIAPVKPQQKTASAPTGVWIISSKPRWVTSSWLDHRSDSWQFLPDGTCILGTATGTYQTLPDNRLKIQIPMQAATPGFTAVFTFALSGTSLTLNNLAESEPVVLTRKSQ